MQAAPTIVELPVNPLTLASEQVPSLKDVERDLDGCQQCTLSVTRSRIVFGEGPSPADLMLIGTAPGRPEDLAGSPFAGAAGNLLGNLLSDARIDRSTCYITSIVKCFPGSSRAPVEAEIEACRDNLIAQIANVRPRVIVAFGELVTWMLLGKPVPIQRVIGFRFDAFDGVTVVPTHSPYDALRGSPTRLSDMARDIRTAKAVLDGRLPTGRQALEELRARQAAGA
ncbi:MAG: uracil-DNA glycosylase [Nitriliruptorales bacterium]|nr:uracil-DNA glycosylase [Nitriliruptorales bacterium]